MVRCNKETRIKAYNYFLELKKRGTPKTELVKSVSKKFNLLKGGVYAWYANRSSPWEVKEKVENLEYRKELFYILGALLGDGCIYYWRGQYQVKVYGEEGFTKKCAERISICLRKKINNYFYKSYYEKRGTKLWFINFNHKKLFNLFKDVRKDLNMLLRLMKRRDYKKNSLQFIEGFFDAEGCVKIIKEPVRMIPKICLDMTNTNYEILELVKKILKERLSIEARYSIQKAFLGKDGCWRHKAYHLRIYRKEFVRKFFENINTTKLSPEKAQYVKNWFNNKDKKEIISS